MTQQPLSLTVAALWGETVIATRELSGADGLTLNATAPGATALPGPENLLGVPLWVLAPVPVGGGWRVDAGGATAGFIDQAGTRLSVLQQTGLAVVNPGDFGVLQYGQDFSVFFQATQRGPKLGRWPRPTVVALLAVSFSTLLVLGVLYLVRALTLPLLTPPLSLFGTTERTALVQAEAASSGVESATIGSAPISDEDPTEQLLQIVAALRSSPDSESPLVPSPNADSSAQRIRVWDRSASTARIFGAHQGLTEAQVNRVLASRLDALQACLSPQAARGQMVIRLLLAADGAVDSASMTHSSLGDAVTERCVLREVWRLGMPAATRPTTAHIVLAMRKN